MSLDRIVMAGANGHLYAVLTFSQNVTWETQNTYTETELEAGTSDWHLATVSSAFENTVLVSLMADSGATASAIGLVQTPGSNEPADGWEWVTGEALTFVSWGGGEPNNAPVDPTSSEDFGEMYNTGGWNDLSALDLHRFALAELDTSRAIDLLGTTGNDRLVGGLFGDRLEGASGKDTLSGSAGDDTVLGGGGNDRIKGGAGQDVLSGGAGRDSFIFTAKDTGNSATPDTVQDFQQGVDVIKFGRFDTTFAFIESASFSATLAEVRAAATGGGNTRIEADIDGDGLADISVILTGTFTLTAADFAL
jgi:hypothetical protein